MKKVNPFRRIAALIYDFFIATALIIIATYALLPVTHGQAIASGNHWYQLYLLILLFAYWGGFWMWRGQTLGMLAWSIKIVNEQGGKISFLQAWFRFVMATGLFFIGWLFCFLNPHRQALYDLFSKTRMIFVERAGRMDISSS